MIKLKRVLLVSGLGLLIFSLVGIIYLLTPLIQAEISYRWPKNSPAEQPVISDKAGFNIDIPKINAQAPVIANVNADDRGEYLPALRKGVAHARGSVFPGLRGSIWLFAHSTNAPWNIVRYNAVFFLLNELVPGDPIKLNFLGKEYVYNVIEKKIVSRTDTGLFSQKDRKLLVLQTCYPPGTTQKALLVIAEEK